LTAAIYVLDCITKGKNKKQQLVKEESLFNGNWKLLFLWINFLKDKHWLEEKIGTDTLKITEKGKEWLRRYSFAIRSK
jgi:hypothetical protein